jgi:DNA-binding NtrC family response regulator
VAHRQTLNGQLTEIVDELVLQGVTLEQARQEFERQFIMASLRSNDWNYCRSARSLGVHRNTLRNKVSHLGIPTLEGRYRPLGGRPPLRRATPKA